jgi:phage major head subunit gpT-like protein
MTVATGNFAELLWPGIREIWGATYNRHEPLYTKIFKVKKSDKAFEKEQGVTNLPLAGVKDQGSPVIFVDPFQGFQKEYVNATYALGSSVTREMFEDDQYNYINRIPEFLAESMRQTEETIHWAVVNNGFTAGFTGADGQVLFSASHPLIGGGTLSNIPDTASDLTQSSLETAFTDIMDFLDDQSLKIRAMPKTLVVPTPLWHVAEKLMGTDKAVGSNDNDINVVRGKMNVVVSPYLTDPDAWFIMTDVKDGLTSYDRRASEIERDNEFDTQNLKFITTKRWSQGWTNFRGMYGSAGA